MKNYKAEIEKIIQNISVQGNELWIVAGEDVCKDTSNQIKSLFREVAKEALPNEIPKSVNDGGQGFFEKRGYINGFNNARSEILSNIEKLL